MQEIKKRRIVIASVLKPVDDTRMFEKIGQSLAEKYEVHIVGYPSSAAPPSSSIRIHPLLPFGRLSMTRMLAPFRILGILFKIRPAVIILTTHELLIAGALYKILQGAKIIYDVHENYFRNILHTKTFPGILRAVLALWVRSNEYILSPFFSHFLLAEKNYEAELSFTGQRKTVLENKILKSQTSAVVQKKLPAQNLHFVFTGTIAESTGIFIALDIVDKLYTEDQTIVFTIIGYCAQQQTLAKIHQRIKDKSYITLVGGDHLVPHTQILKTIQNADMGIISYPANPSTAGSIPTKLYEYLGNHLPILLIDHEPWVNVCEPYQAAISFRPKTFNANVFLTSIHNRTFYPMPVSGVFWEEESPKLMRVIEGCFK